MQSTADSAPLQPVPSPKQPFLGDLIRELRLLANITQGEFGAAIGVSHVTVSRWETGRIQPSKLALRQIQAFIEGLSQTASQPIQVRSQELLDTYFSKKQG